jgi:phosphatidylserine decarboxylase
MSVASFVTAQFLRVLPRARISHAIGGLASTPLSPLVARAVVGVYSQAYHVALDDCTKRSGWASFDEFFTRRLRPDTRPIEGGPETIISPADGDLSSASRIGDGGAFVVKGRPYSVAELVGSAKEAERFRGGVGFVVYLSPRDYHRVHAPVAGEIRRVRCMPGDYFPVNAVGMRHVPNLFCRNRRVAIEIDMTGGLGRVTVVMVVAMIVGRITAIGIENEDVPVGEHSLSPPIQVQRGEEIGVFHLGSTVVVLIEQRAAGGWLTSGGAVRYGQGVVRAREAVSAMIHDGARRPS